MIFNLEIKNKDNIKGEYMIKKRFIITWTIEKGYIPKSNVKVKKHESLYIQRYIDSNDVDISLTITLEKKIKKIEICKSKKHWILKGKKSKNDTPSGDIGNGGNEDEPVVNVEIGGV